MVRHRLTIRTPPFRAAAMGEKGIKSNEGAKIQTPWELNVSASYRLPLKIPILMNMLHDHSIHKFN